MVVLLEVIARCCNGPGRFLSSAARAYKHLFIYKGRAAIELPLGDTTMTTITTASYKRKPFVKKLVFKICAGGLPDQLFCEYLDNIQFALVQAFEFSEEFDLTIEPDHSRAAFKPDWKNADRAYPTGRPFELKAWSTRAAQDLELTALVARVVMPGYLALLDQQKRVEEWLPAWSLEDDKLMLKWFSSTEIHNPLVPRWIREQAAAHLQRVDVEGYSLRQIAALVLARWERIEAKMAA